MSENRRRMRWSPWILAAVPALLILVVVGSALAERPPKAPRPGNGIPNPALIYVRDGNLWHVTSDGNLTEMLVRDRGIRSACWVPDGSAIVFVRNTSSGGVLVAPDGTLIRDIPPIPLGTAPHGTGLQEFRYWAPDDRRLFVQINTGDRWGQQDLGVYDLDTGELQHLGLDSTFNSTIQGGDTTPDLDPDAPGWQGWFVFVARHLDHDPYDDDKYTDYDLWTVWMEEVFDAAGHSTYVVDPGTLWQYWMDGEQNGPLLSPDGQTLIFTTEWKSVTHVASLDLETGTIGPSEILLHGAATLLQGQGLGSWSPDGQWFATKAEGGNIVIVRPDGTDLRLLTYGPKGGVSPSWNPAWINDLD